LKGNKKFDQRVIVRAHGLLPMLYTPRELGEELGVPSRTIREWIKQGMPYQRDEKGFLWIKGSEFAQWVKQMRKGEPKIKLARRSLLCALPQTGQVA